jgi:hypothetical protein
MSLPVWAPQLTTVARLVHRVEARHATSGALVPVRAEAVDAAPGWRLTTKRGQAVVVTTDVADPAAPPPRVALHVVGDALRARLAEPDVVVDLAAPVVVHGFQPLPTVLTVRLVTHAGDARAGLAVLARPVSGAADIPLVEHPQRPGSYSTAPTVFTAAESPLVVLAAATPQRTLAVDTTRAVCELTIVES